MHQEILEYLLEKLRKAGAEQIEFDINHMLSSGKTVTLTNSQDAKLKKAEIKLSDVGKTQIQPLTPEESLEVAIDYLAKVLIDIPEYSKRITEHFGEEVVWKKDDLIDGNQISLIDVEDEFGFDHFKLDEIEVMKLKAILLKIKLILRDNNR